MLGTCCQSGWDCAQAQVKFRGAESTEKGSPDWEEAFEPMWPRCVCFTPQMVLW